jgi:hypothetical protein
MTNYEAGNEDVLLSDEPGDENRVRAVLADWGMDEQAMRPVMKAHRENGRNRDKREAAHYRKLISPAALTVSHDSDKAPRLQP